jgi:hypothetical protein
MNKVMEDNIRSYVTCNDKRKERQVRPMKYIVYWVVPRRLNFISRRFGYRFYLHMWIDVHDNSDRKKCKAIPLEAWRGLEGSRNLRFPEFLTKAQDDGKFVNLTHRPNLPPRKYSWYSFLLEAESTPGT